EQEQRIVSELEPRRLVDQVPQQSKLFRLQAEACPESAWFHRDRKLPTEGGRGVRRKAPSSSRARCSASRTSGSRSDSSLTRRRCTSDSPPSLPSISAA